MDLHITRKGGQEAYPIDQDGTVRCNEGDQIYISVLGEDFATLEVEGFLFPDRTVERQGNLFRTHWQYSPMTYAGRTRLLVSCKDESETVILDIAPAENKLGLDAFLGMVDELDSRIPGLPWGISPGHFQGILGERSAMIVRPVVVEAMLKELFLALRGLRRDPLLFSKQIRETRRMALNRRPDISTVRRLVQKPHAAVAWASMIRAEETATPVINIDQAVTTVSTNHPVTQYLVWLLQRLQKDFDELIGYLQQAQFEKIGGIGEQGRAFCSALIEKISPVRILIIETLRQYPLAGVAPAPLGEGATHALMDHPASLRVHKIAREMSSSGLRPNQDANFFAGLRETCDLYEFLVLFRIADSLANHLGEAWQWRVPQNPEFKLLRDAPVSGLICTSNGTRRIELRTQEKFSRPKGADLGNGFSSLSEKRTPDFVIGVTDEDGTLISWMVLDAKFRTAASAVRDSLKQIHIYRDSLRWNGLKPVGAYAIIPKLRDGATLFAEDAYRTNHNFGVLHCPLEPDEDWLRPVTTWLDSVFEDSKPAYFDYG